MKNSYAEISHAVCDLVNLIRDNEKHIPAATRLLDAAETVCSYYFKNAESDPITIELLSNDFVCDYHDYSEYAQPEDLAFCDLALALHHLRDIYMDVHDLVALDLNDAAAKSVSKWSHKPAEKPAAKSYKNFNKRFIGSSESARLKIESEYGLSDLVFTSDAGCFYAYICYGPAEIGKHYHRVFSCERWFKIHDDNGVTYDYEVPEGDVVDIYRAGGDGCIIHLHN